MQHNAIVVTGGAGFIGSAVIRRLIAETDTTVVNLDSLTYAGNLDSLESVSTSSRYHFHHVDIRDAEQVRAVLERYRPSGVMHLAAESHVDRSIDGPGVFIDTNIVGTYTLLNEVLRLWRSLADEEQDHFRFHHVSTDEVFGSLGADGLFTEETPYQPNSPYSASKASSDHLVRAWHHTYGLPVVTSNCSNNYGPYQFPEKLIPLMILNALESKPLPVYGTGENIRDWLFVDDHAAALCEVLDRGVAGQTYNIGGLNERTNLEVVNAICDVLDATSARADGTRHRDLVEFVPDRPGHDLRYAIDAAKIESELGWRPVETFETGIEKTIRWYMENGRWCERVLDGSYQRERLGTGASQ